MGQMYGSCVDALHWDLGAGDWGRLGGRYLNVYIDLFMYFLLKFANTLDDDTT
jgi:hypothetical protein